MRKKKFQRIKKKGKKNLELDITSLLDILTIILIFLLKNYNATDLNLKLADHITLPTSSSSDLGRHAIIIQINEQRDLWVNEDKIINLSDKVDEEKEVIDVLLEHLKKEFQKRVSEVAVIEKSRGIAGFDQNLLRAKKRQMKMVNIVMDQELPYGILKKIMHTSALAGFPEFKLIVQGNF